jgi:hypothetical protein
MRDRAAGTLRCRPAFEQGSDPHPESVRKAIYLLLTKVRKAFNGSKLLLPYLCEAALRTARFGSPGL